MIFSVTRVQYFTACTLDGFIADENNSLDWLYELPRDDNDHHWEQWFPSIGALVLGATTYEQVIEHEGIGIAPVRWREWYGERPAWVFTHRDLPRLPGVEVNFVQGDVRPVHNEIRGRLAGADIWLVGGGDLVGQFYDAGLLDEIILGMTPVTLGRGAPLLPRRITSAHLTFQEAELVGHRLRIVLEVDRRTRTFLNISPSDAAPDGAKLDRSRRPLSLEARHWFSRQQGGFAGLLRGTVSKNITGRCTVSVRVNHPIRTFNQTSGKPSPPPPIGPPPKQSLVVQSIRNLAHECGGMVSWLMYRGVADPDGSRAAVIRRVDGESWCWKRPL
jgi:dihydrofolate reductase